MSLKPPDDPYTVELERALEVIRLKKEADANRIIQDFGVDNIQVLNGRYGPYITDGKRNARMPKDTDPKTIALETLPRAAGRCTAAWQPLRPQEGRGTGRCRGAPLQRKLQQPRSPRRNPPPRPQARRRPAAAAGETRKETGTAKKKSTARTNAKTGRCRSRKSNSEAQERR